MVRKMFGGKKLWWDFFSVALFHKNETHQKSWYLMYHTKTNSDNLLAIKVKRTPMLMNKNVYLGLSILELTKIVM